MIGNSAFGLRQYESFKLAGLSMPQLGKMKKTGLYIKLTYSPELHNGYVRRTARLLVTT
jgi:hypothetical protein